MSARSAAAIAVREAPKVGASLLLAIAAAVVCPFDSVLTGMIRAGLGVEAICAYLGMSRAIFDYNLIRLDLPTPHDRPRRRGGRRPWSDDEVRCAIYWRRIGVHPESIGLSFHRSTSAVRNKLYRLGVPAPDRRKLHKVDPATLKHIAPDLGFPVPPEQQVSSATTNSGGMSHTVFAIVPAATETGRAVQTIVLTEKGARTRRDGGAPGQSELTLLRDVPSRKAKPANVLDVAVVDTPREQNREALLPVCKTTDDGGRGEARIIGPADLIEQYRVAGKVRYPDTNDAYLKWLTLLYLGGMHYRAMAAYLGRTPSAVQAILYRMQIPRDTDRAKFGRTCDLECAVARMNQWNFELVRCRANPDLPDDKRPLFWRRKNDSGNRKRRCARLKNNEIDEYSKYKGGQTVEIMTRAQLEAQRRMLNTGSGPQQPARLHATMTVSPPIHRGAAHEQFASRGHAPAVRSGLSRNAGKPMPWAYARNGGTARPVAHP